MLAVFRSSYLQVECTNAETSSEFSSISPAVSTLPVPATAPSIATGDIFEESVELVWKAGDPNECAFREWEVVYQEGGSSAWTKATGCGITERGWTNCTATELLCDTNYVFRMREACMDADADSAWADGKAVRTPKGENCFIRATAPAKVQMKEATTSSMVVEWQNGTSNDCTFSAWQVERQDGTSLVYSPAGGTCASLKDREETACEDTDLDSNTNYKFRVRETCDNGEPSPAGEAAAWVQTLAVVSLAPSGVRGTAPTPSSVEVLWAGPDSMGDCAFLRWRVEIREVGGEFVGAGGGCGAWMLTSECRVSCVAEGLRSKTEYELRAQVTEDRLRVPFVFTSYSSMPLR